MVNHKHLYKDLPTVSDIVREIYIKPSLPAIRLAKKYGYLPYIVERYIKILGFKEARSLLESFEKPLQPVIRNNDFLLSSIELTRRLENLGFQLEPIPWDKSAFRAVKQPKSPTIGSTHEYLKGYYYVYRDAASLVPPHLLVHSFHGDALDMCAAPGGKTVLLSQLIGSENYVYSNDLVLYRVKALIAHTARMRLSNVLITWSDARKLPTLMSKRFKRVLLDAPCSGEGTIMFDPGRKTKTKIKDLARIVRREMELLISGLEMLENEGIIAYVTCSIAPEENEYVLSKILSITDNVEVVEPPIKLFDWSPWLRSFHDIDFPSDLRKCIRIWPHRHGMIGMSICLLRRTRH